MDVLLIPLRRLPPSLKLTEMDVVFNPNLKKKLVYELNMFKYVVLFLLIGCVSSFRTVVWHFTSQKMRVTPISNAYVMMYAWYSSAYRLCFSLQHGCQSVTMYVFFSASRLPVFPSLTCMIVSPCVTMYGIFPVDLYTLHYPLNMVVIIFGSPRSFSQTVCLKE